MIADVEVIEKVTRTFKNESDLHLYRGKMHINKEAYLLDVMTSDDRIAEMVETAISVTNNELLNVLVSPYNTASADYVAWAKNQTIEADQSEAYYNVDPFANSTPIANETVAKMKDFKEAAKI